MVWGHELGMNWGSFLRLRAATLWAHMRLQGCWWHLVFCGYRAEVSSLKAKYLRNPKCLYHMDTHLF